MKERTLLAILASVTICLMFAHDANAISVVATIPVGAAPFGAAYDSAMGEIFVANYGSNSVSVISDSTNSVVATIPVGTGPFRVAYDSAMGEIFVANYGSNSVSVISDSTNSVVATIPVGTTPYGIAYDSTKGEMFVTNYGSPSVSVISDSTNSVVATIPVGFEPTGVTYDSAMGEIFVVTVYSASVTIISDSTNSVVATIPVGTSPYDVAYDPAKGEIFVTDTGASSFQVMSDSTNLVVATIPLGTNSYGIAYDSARGEMFVTDSGSNSVSVISDSTNSVVATIPVGANPYGVAYDSAKSEIFVANTNSKSVTVLSDSTAASTSVTVTPNPSTVALSSSITFHAKVTDTSGSPTAPTGTVSWNDGGAGGRFSSSSCTLASISSSASTCSIVYTALTPPGQITITGTYSGDSVHNAISGTSSLTVTLRNTATTVSPNPSTVDLGKTITFTGKVSDTSSGTKITPSGTLSWNDGGAGGSFSAATCTLTSSSSSASTCKIVYTPPSTTGQVTITATYSGDISHKTSSGKSTLTVLRTTSTTISPSAASVLTGGNQLFTATVTDTTSSGTPSAPSGTVSWTATLSGGSFSSISCTLAPISSSQSQCSVTYTAPLKAGSDTITGSYGGDSTHDKSSGKSPLTVNLRSTSTVITPNPSSVTIGNTITFTGTVTDTSPSQITPTGTISWNDGGAGGSFSAATCTLSGGVCTIIYTAPLTAGQVTITGTYSGDSAHAKSSGTSTLTVS
jgi:YVTN family beta-propeller protein